MWIPGEKPDVDDQLMKDWLQSVVDAGGRGITGPRLLATMGELVDHLSAGKRCVDLVKTK